MSAKNDYLESLTDYRPNVCACGGDVWESREINDSERVFRVFRVETRGLGDGTHDAFYTASWRVDLSRGVIDGAFLSVDLSGVASTSRALSGDDIDASAFFRAALAARRLVHLVTDAQHEGTPRASGDATLERHAAMWVDNVSDTLDDLRNDAFSDGITDVSDIPESASEVWDLCYRETEDLCDNLISQFDELTDDFQTFGGYGGALSINIAREFLAIIDTYKLTTFIYNVADVVRWVVAPLVIDYINNVIDY